jgi:hypothetical protein
MVAPAQRSPQARRKAASKLAADNTPLHRFRALLSDPATVAKNRALPAASDPLPFELITTPSRCSSVPSNCSG